MLKNANVAVLWAPFHEYQPSGWFWWSKGTATQFIQLWQYMYNYLTNTKGLNNLVWLRRPAARPTPPGTRARRTSTWPGPTPTRPTRRSRRCSLGA